MMSTTSHWSDQIGSDQVDFRPEPYRGDPLRHLMKISVVTGVLSLILGASIVTARLATLPDIDPMADAALVVDYAAQPPADRGLLAIAPEASDGPVAAMAQAPMVQARRLSAVVPAPQGSLPVDD